MLKLIFLKKQAIFPSQIPAAFKINLCCPVHNFWTETWMPVTERFDQESGNHLFSLDVKVIGSFFGKWHFPWAAGVAVTAGQDLQARAGAWRGQQLLTFSSAYWEDMEESGLGSEICQLTWEGSVELPPRCPHRRAGENHCSRPAEALQRGD